MDDFYRQLGSWCSSQRKNKDKLSQAEIDILESIKGWFWSEVHENKIIRTFEESFKLLEIHIGKTNKYPTKHTDLYLYSWLQKIKEKYRKNKLDPKRVQMLETLPNFKWNDADPFDAKFVELVKWVKKYNKIPSDKSIDKIEKPLGRFATHCRQMRKIGKLSAEKIALLETILHWYWGNQDKIIMKTFDEWFIILTNWFKKNTNMPNVISEDPAEKELAYWCCAQRQKHKKGKLLDDQIIKLSNISNKWYWSKKIATKRSFNEWHNLLYKWYEVNTEPPRQHGDTAEERAIAGWSNNQRKNKKQNKLSADQITTLEKIPNWFW
jgi:hypothetical protein